MPNFHALTSVLNFPNINVVVVGGTQGIGAGVAVRFAELGASVLIVGRNETLGKEMVKKLETASKTRGGDAGGLQFAFVRRDLSIVEEIKRAAEDITSWAEDRGVHYMLLSQGGPSTGFMAPTVETMTTFFNVQILSHFLIPYLLLSRPDPVLRKGAQICNIGRPGEKNQIIDMDDFLCLKVLESGKFNLWKDTMKFVFMVDLFTQDFNMRFPDTHTTHVSPGLVATRGFRHPTVPWYIRLSGYLIPVVGRSPARYADIAIWQMASDEAKGMSRTFWDQHGREVVVDERVSSDSHLRQQVWQNLLNLAQ